MITAVNQMLLELLLHFNTAELSAPFMGLYTNNIGLTQDILLSDLVEPTYTGYAKVALTVQGHRQITGGAWQLLFNPALFQPTANTSLPQTAYGYFVANSNGAMPAVYTLEWAEPFAVPFVFNTDLNAVNITAVLNSLVSNNYGFGQQL